MKWERMLLAGIFVLFLLLLVSYPITRYFLVPVLVKVWPYKRIIGGAILLSLILYLIFRPRIVARLER